MVNANSAMSTIPLSVVASSDFALTAVPGAADLIQGQSVSFVLSLNAANGFSQLASLAVTGVPAGVTASFKPQQIAGGQPSILTLTAPAGQAAGPANLNISASATVDGIPLAHSAGVQLNIVTPTTTFVARTVVDSPLQTPIAGVTLTMLGKDGNGGVTGCTGTGVSDAAGNVALRNLPPSCVGRQLIGIDGTTATSPPGKYAGVNLVYTFTAGQVTASPVLVHLPRIDNLETFLVQQNATVDQSYSFASVPGLSLTVYKGTTFTMPDGSQPNPFPLVAVQVPVDRLPDAKPPVPTMLLVFIVAFQPANVRANQPAAVYYPNTINTPPGSNMPLMTLDPTRGTMVPYGTGTVSADGTQVVPDPDPAISGHRYGIVNFDWHGQMPQPQNQISTSPCSSRAPRSGCTQQCPVAKTDNPVDFASGIETLSSLDLAFGGARGGIAIDRYYRTMGANAGPFGIGTALMRYSYRLITTTPQTQLLINLAFPDGNQFPFARQPDGTLVNSTIPSLRGAVLTTAADNTATLRWKDGTVFRFGVGAAVAFMVLTSIEDPNANVISLTYSSTSGNQLTAIADPVGRQIMLTYGTGNRVASATDPLGRTVTYVYDASARLATVTNPEGGVTNYQYDAQGRMTRIIDPRNVVWIENTYDANGRVIQQLQPDGGRWQMAYTLLNPTAPNSPVIQTVVTDPRGNQTTYRFSPQGFLLGTTDANGETRVFDYEPGSNLLKSIRGAGSCGVCGATTAGDVFFTYDAAGNVLTQTDALGNTTTFTYEPVFNKVATVTDPLNQVTQFAYDASGNLLRVTNPRNNVTQFAYGNFGLLGGVTDAANQTTTMTYDDIGNLQSVRDPLANAANFRYDGVSRLIEWRNPVNGRSQTRYDKMDRVIRQTDPQGQTVQFTYDPIGDLLTLTDPRGKVISYQYDVMTRPARRTDPLGRFETYGYDLAGNLTQHTDRRGQASTLIYDSLNRLTTETYIDATVQRFYDANSRLARVEDSLGGVFSYAYDLDGRLLRSVSPQGAIDYTRDKLGRAASRQVSGQPKLDFTYDPAGNILRSAMPQASIDFAYDSRNVVTGMTRSNGVSSAASYDALGRLLTMTHTKGASTLNQQSYSYDERGFRTSVSDDIAQPLITPAASGSYDDANEMVAFGGRTFTHDANGNRITENDPGGLTTYTWDSRNRLASTSGPSGAQAFRYDFAGNMIRQDLAGGSTSYVLDAITNVAYQFSDSGAKFSFLTGGGIDTHLAAVDGTGQPIFALTGALGSVVANSGPGGAVDGKLFYEPYGQTTSQGATYPFEYTGRSRVAPGLYYYRARFYDPSAGRFISEDPLLLPQVEVNLRRYVYNNPINYRDPSGLWGVGVLGQLSGEAGVLNGLSGTYSVGAGFLSQSGIGLIETAGLLLGGRGTGRSLAGVSRRDSVTGVSGGVSAGFFYTNAVSRCELEGVSPTENYNLGLVSVQYARNGEGKFIVSVTFGSVGLSYSVYNTVTDEPFVR
jgi:RHS repeat-associated protein